MWARAMRSASPLGISFQRWWHGLLRWLRGLRLGGVPRLRHPIVLVHGVCGFSELRLRGRRLQYFRGIPARLADLGVPVYVAELPMVASVATRAAYLADFVSQLPAARVNIIAHSMGGLDARYAITKLGLGTRVASLTTVGTPHRGTPIADAGSRLLGLYAAVQRLCQRMGLDIEALSNLTTDHLATFNATVADDGRVLYACVVGKMRGTTGSDNPMLQPTHQFLLTRTGDNDGLVPTSSQVWGQVIATVDADHWAQVGWTTRKDAFDAPGLFVEVARQLATRGV